MRTATVDRTTNETQISLALNLDGAGDKTISTGIGFLDHMLEQIARHGLIDLEITAKGDLHIDAHHTTEDVGIALGQALRTGLGDMAGIRRYGAADLPMDETLTSCAVDLSGRPFLVWNVEFNAAKIGDFDTELVREFFQALTHNARITLHMNTQYGANNHHIAESCFKGFARALRQAAAVDPRERDRVPSTKGSLTV
jgi:imidazoleglycerol-phosphate dehydratase